MAFFTARFAFISSIFARARYLARSTAPSTSPFSFSAVPWVSRILSPVSPTLDLLRFSYDLVADSAHESSPL